MATLTKHTTFKRLKNPSSTAAKRTAAQNKMAVTEVTSFLQLLSKKKLKTKKA